MTPRTLPRLAAACCLAGALAACSEKAAEFFSYLDGGLGTIATTVNGAPNGASLHLTGNGVDRTQTVGSTGYAFTGLDDGSYNIAITDPAGLHCTPADADVTITPANRSPSVTYECGALPGTIIFTTTGITDNTLFDLSLTGTSALSGQLGSSGHTFQNVQPGHYDWNLSASLRYDCAPKNGSFDLAAGATYQRAIDCTSTLGSLALSVTGTGTTHAITYSGPESGTVQAGETPVTIHVLPGQYSATIPIVTNFTCNNPVQGAVTNGGSTNLVIVCVANPGTITVTQNGAPTATVNFTGPQSGGIVVANGASVPIPNLAPGTYTFTATSAGYDCTTATPMVTLQPGGASALSYGCTATAAMTYSVDLTNAFTPGIVTTGSTVPVLQGATPVGTARLDPFGPGNNYFGSSPFRIGFDWNATWFLHNFTTGGSNYQFTHLDFCATSSFSGARFIGVTYVDDALQTLGSATLSSGPACFSGDTPAGTTGVRFTGAGSGSFDINNIQVTGVSW